MKKHYCFEGCPLLVYDDGRIWSVARQRFLAQHPINRYGHLRVVLKIDGRPRYVAVHKLVLLAFVGKPDPGHECRHLDSNPTNNRLNNLRWGTRLENIKDAQARGTHGKADRRGSRNNQATLSEDAVREIRKRYSDNIPYGKRGAMLDRLAAKFKVKRCTVERVVFNRGWRHV